MGVSPFFYLDNKQIKIVYNLIILELFIILFVYIYYGIRTSNDSSSMSVALDFFYQPYDGLHGESVYSRFLKPLGLWLAYPLNFLGNHNAFALNSSFFQILTIPFFYIFAFKITKSNFLSTLSVLAFIFSPIVIDHTLRSLVDTGNWFLYLFTLFFAYLELQKKTPDVKKLFLISFVCGLSSLMKEMGGSAIIYMNLMLLFNKRFSFSLSYRLKQISLQSFIFLSPLFLNSLLVYSVYEYTYYDWFTYNNNTYSNEGIIHFVASIKNSFGIFFLFFLFYYINNKIYNNLEFNFILLSSVFVFLISVHRDRIFFISFPLIIPFSLLGIHLFVKRFLSDYSNKKGTIIIFTLILFLNYIIYVDNIDYLINL